MLCVQSDVTESSVANDLDNNDPLRCYNPDRMYAKQKFQYGFARVQLLAVVLIVMLAVGFVGWRVQASSDQQHRKASSNDSSRTQNGENPLTTLKDSILSALAPGQESPEVTPDMSVQAPTAQKSPSDLPSAPIPKTSSPTNCLPPDANEYQMYEIDKPNSGIMYNGSYDTSIKFMDALKFAELEDVVDSSQVVVFAPNDYVFENSLSASQLSYMNASAANMRSVVGWHIITSCVIWDDNMENVKSPITLNTLNGPVTYYPGGTGSIESAGIAMWDFFSSNGAVHLITDFIKPPM